MTDRDEEDRIVADTYGIVADDVTGAADALAPFAAAGRRAHLTFEGHEVPDVDVLAVSTASRSLPAGQARGRVDRAARLLHARGIARFFKKIDSTMRGNVVVEVAALLDAVGASAVGVVCPAFPLMGRTVRDGRVLVDGRPPTAAASDEQDLRLAAQPIGDRFAELGDVVSVPLSAVRSGVGAVSAVLRRAPRIVVVDAVESRDLAVIARACSELDRPVVGVGSGGLAAALAGPARVAVPALRCERVVVVVGSLHARSRRQLAELLARPDVATVELEVGHRDDRAGERPAAERVASGAAVTVLTTPTRTGSATPADVAHRLAAHVPGLTGRDACGLVVTGGDVAAAVLRGAGASGVTMLGEVAPGLPVGRVLGGSLAGTPVVTKSGGFGPPGLLTVAVDALQRTP